MPETVADMTVVGLNGTNVGDGLHARLEWSVTGTSTYDHSVIQVYDRYRQAWVPFDGFNGVIKRQTTDIDDNPPQSTEVEGKQPLPGPASFRVCARRRVGDVFVSTPWEYITVKIFYQEMGVPDGSITPIKLEPSFSDDVANAIAEAEAVQMRKDVWDRAEEITEQGTFLVEKLEGLIAKGQLDSAIQSVLTQVETDSSVWDRAAAITEQGTLLVEKLEGLIGKTQLDSAVQAILDDVEGSSAVWDRAAAITAQGTFLVDKIEGLVAKAQLDTTVQAILDDIEANSTVWDRASAITEQGTFLTEKLEGLIGKIQLETAVQATLDQVGVNAQDILNTINTLGLAPDAEGQFAAIAHTASEITSIVGHLNDDAQAVDQYSAIKQTADEIASVVATLGLAPDDPSQFTSIRQNAQEIALRAYQQDLDTLAGEVSANAMAIQTNTADIQVNAGEITAIVQRIEHTAVVSGTVSSATSNTLSDFTKDFIGASIRPGFLVELTATHEMRTISGVAANQITISAPWSTTPQAGDSYRISSVSVLAASGITQNAQEIALRVTQTEFNDLSNQVSSNTAQIQVNADTITSEVSRIESKLNSTDSAAWYSSIKQTADEITSVVATLNIPPDDPDWDTLQYTSIKQTDSKIESVVATLDSDPQAVNQYSAIRQTADQIDSVVATLGLDPDNPQQYTAIKQNAAEIALRAYQSDLDDLSDEVRTNTSNIQQNADQISAVVQRIEHTGILSGTVTSATATTLSDTTKDFVTAGIKPGFLVELIETLELRAVSGVSQTQLTVSQPWSVTPQAGAQYRVSSVSVLAASGITQNASEIALRVTHTEFDDLEDRVSTNEANISINAGTIISEISRVETKLNSSDPQAWYSSIKQTADEISSVVTTLNQAADAPGQYSAITQNATAISTVVSTLNSAPDAPDQYSSIQQTASEINAIVATLSLGPDNPSQYTAIKQNASEIALRAYQSDLDDLGDLVSTNTANIQVNANAITAVVQRLEHTAVVSGTVTSATSNTLTDSTKNFASAGIKPGFLVELTGSMELRAVSAVSTSTLTVSEPWSAVPQVGASYRVSSVSVLASSGITQNAAEIALRVTQTAFDNLADRVTTNEASIQANADAITSEVSRIEAALNSSDPQVWYSSIKQTADEITSVIATLNLDPDAPGQYSSITQNASSISTVISTLNSAPDAAGQYSAITQTLDEINAIVATLNLTPDHANQYTAIKQNAQEIALRAYQSEVDEISDQVDTNTADIQVNADAITAVVTRLEHTAIVSGTVTSATATTLTDSTKNFVTAGIMPGFLVELTATREVRAVSSVGTQKLTISQPWSSTPTAGAAYRVSSVSVMASSGITQNAAEIALRVKQTDFNDLATQVAANEAAIQVNAGAITSEVSRVETNLNSTNSAVWYSSIKQTADEIASVVATLNIPPGDPDWDTLQYTSIKQTDDKIESVVATLNSSNDDPDQYSAITQTAEQIQSLVAAFEDHEIVTGNASAADATSITDSTKNFLTLGIRNGYHLEVTVGSGMPQSRVITAVTATKLTVAEPFSPAPTAGTSYRVASVTAMTASQINQRADEINLIVSTLNMPLDDPNWDDMQYAAIRLSKQEIDLRVKNTEVISAINMSEEGIKLRADRIEFLTNSIGLSSWAETWEDFPADWNVRAGSLSNLSLISSSDDVSLTSGKILRASGYAWIAYPGNIPYNPDMTYRLAARVRQVQDPTSGGKGIYVGVEGIAADGTTLVNSSGANTSSSQHYIAASNEQLPAGGPWVEFVGYFRGHAASGNSGKHPNLNDPATLHDNVRYIRPLLILNYSGGNGIAEVDYVHLEPVTVTGALEALDNQIWIDDTGLHFKATGQNYTGLLLDHTGVFGYKQDTGEQMFKLDTINGNAEFAGSVRASTFILPVRSEPIVG